VSVDTSEQSIWWHQMIMLLGQARRLEGLRQSGSITQEFNDNDDGCKNLIWSHVSFVLHLMLS
jgi:hypothetical protein